MVLKGAHRKGAGSGGTLHRGHLTLKFQLAEKNDVSLQTACVQLVFFILRFGILPLLAAGIERGFVMQQRSPART